MDIGTVETVEETRKNRKLKTGPSFRTGGRQSSSGGNGGNGGGGNNGGGDKPGDGNRGGTEQNPNTSPETTRVLMWFLLMVVIMTFGALIGAYVVLSTNKALEWRPFDLPVQVWISTLLILASSVTYHFAKRNVKNTRYKNARSWFIATTLLGAGFISSQILVWMKLYNLGLYASGNPYAGFFYILTGAHVVHVIGGIAALGYVILRVWNLRPDAALRLKKEAEVSSIGLYWHTMDALWLVLLFLLGFWK